MWRGVAGTDRWVARTRPAWLWLGQLALVVLGVHLAADRLDDALAGWLAASPIPWPEPEQPLTLGTWAAVGLELAGVAWATLTLFRASAPPVAGAREWVRRGSVHTWLAPLFWAPTALAGAWVLGMAVEDAVAAWAPAAAAPCGWVAAGLVAWRLGLTGLLRVVVATPVPVRRAEGAWAAAPILLLTAFAVRFGLPVWGWVP